ncbi:MAG: hypothetical protein ACLTSL_05540 [Odoribacter splanchnicus]
MRKIYVIIFLLWGITSCSIDEKLEYSSELKVISMESEIIPTCVIGEEVYFKVMASSNDGLQKLEISAATPGLKVEAEKLQFVMVGDEPLLLDEEGRFSRSVSSVGVHYPLVVSPEFLGDTIYIEFAFTANGGARKTVRVSYSVTNIKLNKQETLFYNLFPQVDGNMFYSSVKHMAYSYQQYKSNIQDIDMFVYYDSNIHKHYLMSPNYARVKNLVDAVPNIETILVTPYSLEEMNQTLFVKLASKDLEEYDSQDLDSLEFTKATNEVEFVQGDFIAFLTQDGRKGVLNISTINAYNVSKVKSVVQVKM